MGYEWLRGAPGKWFPDDPWSVASHPALADALRPKVAAGLILAHLDFTIQLENLCISPVARDIAARALSAQYPDALVRDALRIQCDEAYHALLALELAAHVARMSGVERVQREHRFLRQIAVLQRLVAGRVEAAQLSFCAAVVAETVITKMLREDWQDTGVQGDIRAFWLHHYQDEARHGIFFTQALRIVWPQWDPTVRAAIEPFWPQLIEAFLSPADAIALDVLIEAGVERGRARMIAEDCRVRAAGADTRRASIEQTLHSLQRAGAWRGNPRGALAEPGPVQQPPSTAGAAS